MTPLNFHIYTDRRKYTDYVHQKWIPKIYQLLNWQQVNINDPELKWYLDVQKGQDYYVKDSQNNILSIQERNRTGNKALRYNDITIRYQYPEYAKKHQLSEWFKIDTDIMIYTVIGTEPEYLEEIDNYQDFDKVIVIDMRIFEQQVKSKHIQISPALQTQTSMFSHQYPNVLLSPLRQNKSHSHDSASTFIVFDVTHLYQLNPNMILYDKGFGTPKDVK